ncbi:hypothetical protein E2C01_069611 [Portunus trituberculatus]|uniref:Uncharacterized protein n=1 Tax=Portunus trituberculatus TaxID=210409 RepID=A0A5B7I197_PORTR|nr:hypothetical protein [Portunus trituberculatus]
MHPDFSARLVLRVTRQLHFTANLNPANPCVNLHPRSGIVRALHHCSFLSYFLFTSPLAVTSKHSTLRFTSPFQTLHVLFVNMFLNPFSHSTSLLCHASLPSQPILISTFFAVCPRYISPPISSPLHHSCPCCRAFNCRLLPLRPPSLFNLFLGSSHDLLLIRGRQAVGGEQSWKCERVEL